MNDYSSFATGSDFIEAEHVCRELASWASAQIVNRRPTQVMTKAHGADLVTDLDRAIEDHVRQVFADRLPEHALVGEEYGATGPTEAQYTWYCDPIDGTTNYTHNLGFSSFTLCCFDDIGPAYSMVVNPYLRFSVTARRGGGAVRCELDDNFTFTGQEIPLCVSKATTLSGEVITTELQAHLPWTGMTTLVEELARRECTLRILGSSALSLLHVALGNAVGSLLGRYSIIDNPGSILAALEAGAVVMDESGNRILVPESGGILLAVPHLADELYNLWATARENGGFRSNR